MKSKPAFGILILCIGLCIGWLIKTQASQKSASAPAPGGGREPASYRASHDDAASPVKGKRSQREPKTTTENVADNSAVSESEELLNGQREAISSLVKSQRYLLNQLILHRAEALNLTPAQKAAMSAWLDVMIITSDSFDPNDKASMQAFADSVRELNLETIDEELASILDDGQQAGYEAVLAKELQTKTDSTALKSLGKMQELSPFLNPAQIKQYRAELKVRGAGVYGNSTRVTSKS